MKKIWERGRCFSRRTALAKAGIEPRREWQRRPEAEGEASLAPLASTIECTTESKIPRNALVSNDTDRRGWDSNPRYGYPYNGFRDRSSQLRLVRAAILTLGGCRSPQPISD